MSEQAADYFSMLGVPRQFDVDEASLTRAYRELQRSVHPDRFAGGSDRERRLAVQKSSQINEAYETLRSVTRRAAYLLKLAGHPVDTSNTTFSDPEFLMQQLQLREELSDLHDATDPEAALDAFYRDVDNAMAEQKAVFVTGLDADIEQAKAAYAKLQFLEKLRSEAEQKESQLLDY
ncbi:MULTISPECIES: Fe-S protein assembly co-chaperone HscB [Spongiibacter]|uniref:Fe-S protein assembly co-chaperone HscB n=1 Tax=Spongiibacter TaxID=630749 RepID=UPI000C363191|nr:MULTISPECIES: Fe-S protein assembly co-chaperone HscB [Spongiibacter]MAY37303.1 Fe-S protein assembly co-chaperone HscB [Spongiibacter sp.]MBI58191.1 Fe-S protein assembly co-chaperone HscB [Spongiibacter sp.]|tara:strand:- start:1005 stop:1535 length:531 start_codon:yes stop_codon:yes gene_type:complete